VAREYFKAYHSYLESIEPLGDAERGRLFTALLTYSRTGIVPELQGNERFVFPTLKSNIEREIASYEENSAKNAINGSKGGRPQKTQKTQSVFSVFEKTQKRQDKEEDKDKEKDKEDIERNINISLAQKSDDFDRFWSAYPRKKAKADAQKAWKGVKVELSVILNAIEQQKRSPDWQKEGGKYIPYPASWLRGKRWEDTDSQESDGPVIHEAPPEWDYDPNKGLLERLGVEF